MPPLERCSSCQMMQRYDNCRELTNANVLVIYEHEGMKKMLQCHAYDDVLLEMAGEQEDLAQDSLLKAAP